MDETSVLTLSDHFYGFVEVVELYLHRMHSSEQFTFSTTSVQIFIKFEEYTVLCTSKLMLHGQNYSTFSFPPQSISLILWGKQHCYLCPNK